jgi:hypothetical protein
MTGRGVKRSDRGLFQHPIPLVARRHWGKWQKTLVRLGRVLVKIRIEHFTNRSEAVRCIRRFLVRISVRKTGYLC